MSQMTKVQRLKPTLTLTLSHPMGEGTGCAALPFFVSASGKSSGSFSSETEYDSPSPVGRERAGVRAFR